MYAVFYGKDYVNAAGFQNHLSKESMLAAEDKAIKNAKSVLKRLENDEKVLSYVIWIVEYQNDVEVGEREIVGEKRVSYEEKCRKLNEVRAKMGLKPFEFSFLK